MPNGKQIRLDQNGWEEKTLSLRNEKSDLYAVNNCRQFKRIKRTNRIDQILITLAIIFIFTDCRYAAPFMVDQMIIYLPAGARIKPCIIEVL